MAVHTEISPAEAADRLAIRELFDAYAHCADRRDAEGQKALFTTGTRFAVYMSGPDTNPTYVLEGRDALTPVFEALNEYQATTHFTGQSTVVLDSERATGESYTIAHHLFTADGERKIWECRSCRPPAGPRSARRLGLVPVRAPRWPGSVLAAPGSARARRRLRPAAGGGPGSAARLA